MRADDPEGEAISLSVDQVDKYVYWRALGRPWMKAAELTGIVDLEQAKLLERSEQFVDQMQAKRDSIIANPLAEVDNLMIDAIGIFAERLQAGDPAAARDLIRARTAMGRESKPTAGQKSVRDGQDRRPAETVQERTSIIDTARIIRSS